MGGMDVQKGRYGHSKSAVWTSKTGGMDVQNGRYGRSKWAVWTFKMGGMDVQNLPTFSLFFKIKHYTQLCVVLMTSSRKDFFMFTGPCIILIVE